MVCLFSLAAAAALLGAGAPEGRALASALLRALHPGLALLARDLRSTQGTMSGLFVLFVDCSFLFVLCADVGLLISLYDDLVFAAANAGELEARQSVAECLTEVGKELMRLLK